MAEVHGNQTHLTPSSDGTPERIAIFPDKLICYSYRSNFFEKSPLFGFLYLIKLQMGQKNITINAFFIMQNIIDKHKCIIYNSFMLFYIGKEIRQARKNRKVSQTKLAKALGMSRTTIGQIENGSVQEIGVRKLIRVLEFLGLELRVRPAGRPPTMEELREEGAL